MSGGYTVAFSTSAAFFIRDRDLAAFLPLALGIFLNTIIIIILIITVIKNEVLLGARARAKRAGRR